MLSLSQMKGLASWLLKAIKDMETERVERFPELLRVLEQTMGEPMDFRSRESRYVWGRAFIAYTMRGEGFTNQWIADCMGKDHADVFFLCSKMKEALKHPNMYNDVIPLWDDFIKNLNNETLKGTIYQPCTL